MTDLDGRIIVVTGAGAGIGRGIATHLAALGARVVAADLNADTAAETAQSIEQAGGVARAAQVDIADTESVQALYRDVLANERGYDVLVNNAGWEQIRRFTETDPALWERLLHVNLFGPINVTHTFMAHLIEREAGTIVNIASDAGRVGSSGEAVYSGAKGGVIAFTKSLARELARHHINVNCVCPGPTDTDAFAKVPDKLKAALIRAIPLRRVAQPADIAHAVAFFASPLSSYITGQVLSVNGGLTMVG